MPRNRKRKFGPGENPKSIEALEQHRHVQPMLHESPKKTRSFTVTEVGWKGFAEVAQELGLSRSELVEQIGRRLIKVSVETAE